MARKHTKVNAPRDRHDDAVIEELWALWEKTSPREKRYFLEFAEGRHFAKWPNWEIETDEEHEERRQRHLEQMRQARESTRGSKP